MNIPEQMYNIARSEHDYSGSEYSLILRLVLWRQGGGNVTFDTLSLTPDFSDFEC